MTNNFLVQKGERLIIAATPQFPEILRSDEAWNIQYRWKEISRFDARNEYVEKLLYPYRWLKYPNNNIIHISDYDNVEWFYSQSNNLGAYGIDNLICYSQLSGPGNWGIHQSDSRDFTPDEALGAMMIKFDSGTGASSDRTALMMMLVGEDSFRNQVLTLLNAYRQENPIEPEIYENGQVHVLRLGFMKDINALIEKMGKPNAYTDSDDIINTILGIEAKDSQMISMESLLPGFNFWQIHDVRYAAYIWNEKNEWIADMRVEVDYAHPENIKLHISKLS